LRLKVTRRRILKRGFYEGSPAAYPDRRMTAAGFPRSLVAALAAALLLIGCGSSGSSSAGGPAPRSATLVLDFTPNAVHAGIYEALARHDDLHAGVRLHIVIPSASTDSIKLLETGRANFAILDIHDLAIARERGQDIVGVMAIVQRPLAAVIAAPSIANPRGLDGHLVGVTGVPSDTAVLHSIVAGAGGAPGRVRTITIGYNAVADLLAGRVSAATAFWNDEGVTLRQHDPHFHIFRVDQYGAPAYPELVLCATAASLRADPGLARAVVNALTDGYRQVLADPEAGARALESQVPALDGPLVRTELHGLLSAFDQPGGRVGALEPARLRAWARWEQRFGIVSRRPDVAAAFTQRFAPAG
jgi:ABC-type nitrate/sulfonate/bicarbonate transport system substrate-binding protein